MNREHFLIELKLHLRQLSLVDQQAILAKYDEVFDEKLAQGLTEYQVTKELDSPKKIATAILKEFNLVFEENTQASSDWVEFSNTTNPYTETSYAHPYYEENASYPKTSGFVRFFQVTGVLALNFLFMIWIIISWALVLFSGWLATSIFVLSPILGIFSFISAAGAYGAFQLSVSVFLCGAGLIGLLIMIPFSKVSFKLLSIYGKWNIQVLRGDRAL